MIDRDLTGGSSEGTSEGLVTRGHTQERSFEKKKDGSRSRSKSKNKICKYCKKKGHVIADCFKLKNKEKRQEEKSKNIAEAGVAKDESDDYVLPVNAV